MKNRNIGLGIFCFILGIFLFIETQFTSAQNYQDNPTLFGIFIVVMNVLSSAVLIILGLIEIVGEDKNERR